MIDTSPSAARTARRRAARAASCLCFLVLFWSLATPASSAPPTQEELEAELERELGISPDPAPPPLPAPRASPGKLLPDISLIGTFAAAWFSDEPSLRLAAHEPLHRGFQLQEIELAFQSNIDPYLRADVFLAISLDGLEVEEAYVTTLGLPANLQLRGGQLYAPFGRFNQLHFLEATPFADMPLVNRRFFGGEQLRGVGVEASVLLPLPFYVELRAALLSAVNEVSFGLEAEDTEDLGDLLTVVRAATSFDLGDRFTVLAGVSAAQGPNTSGGPETTADHRTGLLGADLHLRLRDPSSRAYTALQAEWAFRRATVPGGRVEQGGAYLWLVRRFDAHWEAAIRGDLLGLPDGRSIGAPAPEGEIAPFLEPVTQQRVGASLSYYLSEFQRLRLQANQDFTPGGDGVQEVFLQYQFIIGSHGAHVF